MSSTNYRKEKDCLNCGHIVEDKFCSACGQENIVVKEKAMHMVIHAIADYFHFENKFFGTLKPLFFQPGVLTNLYVNGKRASFLHPVKLYIFVSIVFFVAVLSGNTELETKTSKENNARDSANVARVLKSVGVERDSINQIAKQVKPSSNLPIEAPESIPSTWTLDSDTTFDAYLNRVHLLPKDQQPGIIKQHLAKSNIKLRNKDSRPAFIKSITNNIPKMMFVILPLFAAILHLFYLSKKRFYFEDLIYAFHLHSLIFLTLLLGNFISWAVGFVVEIDGLVVFITWIYLTWYIYRSLRTFYGSSRWITIIKMTILLFVYFILMAICFVGLALIITVFQ